MCTTKCGDRLFMAFVLLASVSPSATQNIFKRAMPPFPGKVTNVSAVVGGEIVLPCDTRPTTKNDTLLLIVWYTDDNPVYSYDTRVKGPEAHWIDVPYRERATWINSPSPGLRLENIQTRDRAIYRCRVDFLQSPTKNYKTSLDVIELPSKPVIFDEFGKEIREIAGPYNEGGEFKLICTVKGGTPSPKMMWQQDELTLVTSSPDDFQPVESTKSLVLVIRNASRDYLSSVYTCTADNTLLAPPQKASVRVDLYLKPLTIEIISKEQPLSVGRKADLWCRSTGARPAANITWWLGGKLLKSITKYSGLDANGTLSQLQWVPLKEDNGQVVHCRAEHSKFNHTIESKLLLNIYYGPETTIHLGSNMNPNDIEEGDDVYFACKVDANPPAYKVVWEHNGVQLQHNPSNGVIISGNANMALRKVSRQLMGNYSCIASNVEGDGRSQPLKMSIIYKPICKVKEMKIQGAALQEPLNVMCEVESYPPPETFEWAMNNSGGFIKVDPSRFTMEMHDEKSTGRSILTYTPVSEFDYGTLSCRATNLAGQQVVPCVYMLLPATRPDPPSNCTVNNLTHDSLDLLCIAGYEGGLQSSYTAEIWAREGLVVNATNDSTLWNLRRLGSERKLKLVVYAANARGRSEHVTFTVETAPKLLPKSEAQDAWELNWAVGIILGAILTVLIILCLALILSRLRHRTSDYEVTVPSMNNQKIIVPKRNSIHAPDELNPDLIPLNKVGLSDCPPQPPSYSTVVATLTKNSGSAHILHSPTTQALSQGHYTTSQNELGRGYNNGLGKFHREVVTTRTPLLSAQKESRV